MILVTIFTFFFFTNLLKVLFNKKSNDLLKFVLYYNRLDYITSLIIKFVNLNSDIYVKFEI